MRPGPGLTNGFVQREQVQVIMPYGTRRYGQRHRACQQCIAGALGSVSENQSTRQHHLYSCRGMITQAEAQPDHAAIAIPLHLVRSVTGAFNGMMPFHGTRGETDPRGQAERVAGYLDGPGYRRGNGRS